MRDAVMFIIVAGCGRLGSRLSRNLSEAGHDVVVVAKADELKRLDKVFDGVCLSGNPIDEDLLKRGGIEKADAVIAVTADDNVNVMVAQIAKEIYGVAFVVARISDPEREEFYQQLGLTTVCPTNMGINQIAGWLNDNH
jgi:trk system potassium uptake protein TrkA